MNLDKLRAIVDAATPGPWNYENERYSSRCVIGLKPQDDRWLAHCQPALNGEANGAFIAAFNPTVVKAMLDVCEAADQLGQAAHDLSMRTALAAHDLSMRTALAALDEALKAP